MEGFRKNTRRLQLVERIAVAGIMLSSILGGLIYGYVMSEVARRDKLTYLANYRPAPPTRLYDRSGRVFSELYRQKQEIVPYRDIPQHVIQAFLAVEDDNFYNHFGIDIMGIARAMVKNILAGRVVQGGSTLTQQLAKQLMLIEEGTRARTFDQKLRETILALQLEEELSKEEILETYLNIIYLGHGCKGVSCASRLFYEKNVQDLTIPEAAVLARMPKAPVDYSPFRNPKSAMKQNKYVLSRMAEEGVINEEDIEDIHYRFWKAYWPRIVVKAPSETVRSGRVNEAPYFTEHVRQILETNPSIGQERLYSEGLRVYTTLDLDLQRAAENQVQRSLKKVNVYQPIRRANVAESTRDPKTPEGIFKKEFEKSTELDVLQLLGYLTPGNNSSAALERFRQESVSYRTNREIQSAFISIEPGTGFITSMIGGSDFSPKNQFNRAIQAKRQPGSAFKIFVYGAGLETREINSTTGFNDAPFATISRSGRIWDPGNYDEGFRGTVPADLALALSINTCAVQAFFRTGAEPVISLASRLLKVRDVDRFNPDPAMALGSSEVTPFEMATALAILANDGKEVIPYAVRYVTDSNGNILYNQEANIRRAIAIKTRQRKIQVVDPGLAYIIRTMMQKVVNEGTASQGIRSWEGGSFTGDLAAKTGTTQDWSDAWIVAFNPDHAFAVWFGYDQSMFSMAGGQAGGSLASPTLGRVLRDYYNSVPNHPPKFSNTRPTEVIGAGCNGLALKPAVIAGEEKAAPEEGVCSNDEDLAMYDQRELLMKEFGITKEELGSQGRLRFKHEGLDEAAEERRKKIEKERQERLMRQYEQRKRESEQTGGN